ncbi:MAG: emp24/gp25L/p24 family protein [Asgard group archaeon]|nr:emp24/gp25L/p24 family protein [Asgard group archaeon]
MKIKTKTIWLNFMGLIFLFIIMFIAKGMIIDAVISDSVTLSPLEEEAVSVRLHDGDTVEFSVTVTSGTIDIYIFDSENYVDRIYYEKTFDDITSSFQTEFTALWTDKFFIVFYNPSATNSASISYTVEAGLEFTTNMIVNLVIAGVLLGVILVVNFTGKKNPNISS